MKKFSLEEYLKNPDRKVVTRNGRPARIICTDSRSEAGCVVGLVGEKDVIYVWDEHGSHKVSGDPNHDLYFAGEDVKNTAPSRETILGIWELGNFWKENPEEREGLTQLQYIQKYWFEKNDYKNRQDALEDLPKWKKAAASLGNYVVAPTETGELCLLVDRYYILLSDLMKLPKEE